jgi:hypothetical protein
MPKLRNLFDGLNAHERRQMIYRSLKATLPWISNGLHLWLGGEPRIKDSAPASGARKGVDFVLCTLCHHICVLLLRVFIKTHQLWLPVQTSDRKRRSSIHHGISRVARLSTDFVAAFRLIDFPALSMLCAILMPYNLSRRV